MDNQKMIIRISVRSLVEFLLRSGSLDTQTGPSAETAMLEGARIHRALQKKAGDGYRAEVSLRLDVPVAMQEEKPQEEKPQEEKQQQEKLQEEKQEQEQAAEGSAVCQDRNTESSEPGDSDGGCPGEAVLRLEGRADGVFFMKRAEGEPEDPYASSAKKRRREEQSADFKKIRDKHAAAAGESGMEQAEDEAADDPLADGLWTIDEIKTVSGGLRSMEGPEEIHLAQARCYAYMFACREGLDRMKIRMTYCSQATGEIRCFYEEMSFDHLKEWFTGLVRAYAPWVRLRLSFGRARQDTIRQMTFPFPYREGQYELAAGVYRTIVHGKKLFLQAPTGTGKTMAVLFPALKAIGEEKAQRIFYLTARGVTGTVALEALSLLHERGLNIRSLSLISRERACPFAQTDCRPEACNRADGHFDRVNKALWELLQGAADGAPMTSQVIAECAQRNRVCPYSLSLDAADFADVIVCDYNYVFHPQARLTGFFGEPVYLDARLPDGPGRRQSEKTGAQMPADAQAGQPGKPGAQEQAGPGTQKSGRPGAAGGDGTVLLIDEAHNLLERGREMYSAQISYTQVRKFRKSVKTVWPRLWKAMKGLVHVLNVLKKEAEEDVGKIRVLHDWTFHWEEKITEQTGQTEQTMEESARAEDDPVMGLRRDPLPQKPQENRVPALRQELSSAVEEVRNQIQWILEQENRRASLYEAAKPAELSERAESSDRAEPEAGSRPTGSEQAGLTELLEFYFGLCHFGQMLDGIDGHYIVYTVKGTGSPSGGGFSLHLYCADPSGHLRACMNKLTAAVFFSATFLPIQYYKGLLGGTAGDFEMYARSSFSPAQRKVVIVRDVTSRYRDRNEESYARIARSIGQVVTCRPGNYMVYFPSYAFLEKVLEAFCEAFHPAMDRRDVGRDGFPAEEGKEKLAKPAEEGKEKPAKPAEKDFYVIAQRREMDDQERAAFLQAFEDNLSDRHLVGFCVLGGMFSEGIDLRNDRLIGSLIVGTGIPPVEPQRELLRDYFSGQGRNGYDFAYRYPGMNKVLQAAGRVIRTAEDVGIVVLMDGRFAERSSRELFPLEWGQPESVESGDAADRIRRFWEENQ